jgi:hypothetical protein
MGFKPMGEVENLRAIKLQDDNGAVIELIQGNWHDHLSVNFYEDEDGTFLEVVSENSRRDRA